MQELEEDDDQIWVHEHRCIRAGLEEAGRGGWRADSVCDGCGSAVDARVELRPSGLFGEGGNAVSES